MSFVTLDEIEFTKGKKASSHGRISKTAICLMNKRNQIHKNGDDKELDIFEFILACYEVSQKLNRPNSKTK